MSNPEFNLTDEISVTDSSLGQDRAQFKTSVSWLLPTYSEVIIHHDDKEL